MSRQEQDLIDYIDDKSQNEDETAFLPVRPDGYPDSWTVFFLGIFFAIAAGALIPVSPWLGGTLVFGGYGAAALTLTGTKNRVSRALRFGFAVFAVIGAVIVTGMIAWPTITRSMVDAAAETNLVFLSVALLPWLLATFRYIHIRIPD
ncbi:hypothetical protein [Rhodomicrobium lacus]|jgi:hypothetical protein|uniref:hypothetical protein n=1 Tax=Rhodomicrobium TaxID=1068 RepID=UPI0026E42685|nr:hypothetical protein [Rhodomicrobium lacus]WKW51733.1 hypothetical protein QMO75_04420 [Rhodomicrobium lacus]